MYFIPNRSTTAPNAQTQALLTEPEQSSSKPDHKEIRPSMLYNLLPTVVQSHLPTFPSIRRSVSDLRGRAVHSKSVSITPTDTETVPPETPPPTYSSRRGSDGRRPASIISTDAEEIEFQDDVSERPASSISTPPPFTVSETVTGINWKYANQGISLLTQAYQESNALSQDADETSAILTRQLYLHGMTYLLRGLPSELSKEETLSLHAAIPGSVTKLFDDPTAHALVPRSQQTEVAHQGLAQPPSVLHRITATVVFQIFVLFQFLLPYMKLFIGHAYRFERDHKVAQRIVNGSITTVDELGRRSLQLSQTVCQMNDGKVGQAINDLTIWWVRGLTGGMQQGITEGVIVIGNERSASAKRRSIEKTD